MSVHQLRSQGRRIEAFVLDAQNRAADPAPIPASPADIAAARAYASAKTKNPVAAAQYLTANAESVLRGQRSIATGLNPEPPEAA
jgi:hypothetical protein